MPFLKETWAFLDLITKTVQQWRWSFGCLPPNQSAWGPAMLNSSFSPTCPRRAAKDAFISCISAPMWGPGFSFQLWPDIWGGNKWMEDESSSSYLLFIFIFKAELQRDEKHTPVFHMIAHSPNGNNSCWNWANWKPGSLGLPSRCYSANPMPFK